MKPAPRPRNRDAIKAWNRDKIINATIDVLSTHGIRGTTVARVVKLAEVSTGLINAHFKSMNALLDEVLRQMSETYKRHWQECLQQVPETPMARIAALIEADFDPKVLNLRTMGIWFAFRAQARTRPEYVDLVGTREQEQMQTMVALFAQLNQESGRHHRPETVAKGLTAMLDGLWTDFYLYPDDFDHADALASVYLFLDALYPGDFYRPGFRNDSSDLPDLCD